MIAIEIKADPEDIRKARKQFNMLSTSVQDKIFRAVLRKQAKPVEKKMRFEAPLSDFGSKSKKYPSRSHPAGHLKASIGIIASRKGKYPTVWVRPRFKGKWNPWYEHFPIGGFGKGETPDPFIDRAWNATKAGVKSGIKSDMNRMIQERINRL